MNINSIQNGFYIPKNKIDKNKSIDNHKTSNNKNLKTLPYFSAYHINFKGNASRIDNAYIITGEENDLPLLVTKKNDSYVVEFDSQTEIIYGIDAKRYLENKDYFEYDTQIIFPKKSKGKITLENGKTITTDENSAILINEGTKAKVDSTKGYPFIVISKKDFDWYERHNNHAQNQDIKNKFLELIYYNSRLYNAEFTPNSLLDKSMLEEDFLKEAGIDKWGARNNLINEIYAKKDLLNEENRQSIELRKKLYDKLKNCELIEQTNDGYMKFKLMPKFEFLQKILKDTGFDEDEIAILEPVIKQAREIKMESRSAARNHIDNYDKELVKKMKERGILYDNKKYEDKYIYWRNFYGNENDLRAELYSKGFSKDEEDKIIESWKETNMTGFDLSGLKFIDENVALYDLNGKLNNWTQEKTNWISNSTALANNEGKTPFIGTSLVQTDENKVFAMSEIRKEEKLHAHPNLEEKRQTEVYLITSGAAALNVVKNGKSCVKILKQGELAVVGPGVQHCVNSILGEYEHIVVQIPSAFQYGFSFKSIVEPPEDYNEEQLKQEAFKNLYELQSN